MKLILKILGFFRAQPGEIPDKLSLKAMEIVSQGLEADVASPVWDQVFSKFPISGRINSGNVNAAEIKRFYENYFVNGLSDGACAGMGLSRPRFIFRYWHRSRTEIKKLEKLTDIQSNRPMHRPLSPLLDSVNHGCLSMEIRRLIQNIQITNISLGKLSISQPRKCHSRFYWRWQRCFCRT